MQVEDFSNQLDFDFISSNIYYDHNLEQRKIKIELVQEMFNQENF